MNEVLPGAHLDSAKMPGHWLLARLGKRVLRPGGRELTTWMLNALRITTSDRVVELAPGLGVTARQVLERSPASYTGVEQDAEAAAGLVRLLKGAGRLVEGTAAQTGLPDASASVVFGEALLSMQTAKQKSAIVAEAFRLLEPGGRYAIHELGLEPDDLPEEQKAQIFTDLSKSIHVGARPLTVAEWRELLEAEGFLVTRSSCAPMHLLELRRLIADEGVRGVVRFARRLTQDRAAQRRVWDMHRTVRRHRRVLCAVALMARKPEASAN